MNWKIGIAIYINPYTLPCVKQIAGKKLLCGTGSSARYSVMI